MLIEGHLNLAKLQLPCPHSNQCIYVHVYSWPEHNTLRKIESAHFKKSIALIYYVMDRQRIDAVFEIKHEGAARVFDVEDTSDEFVDPT